jgi:5-methylcytosine-specific restriction protein A
MADNVKRSRSMVEAAYFLARFGEQSAIGTTAPPRELEVSSWKHAYAAFYSMLGEGRTLRSFANSLKNARDVYDAHIPTGRIGWRQSGTDRPPLDLPSTHKEVWDEWTSRERQDLWASVRENTDLGVGAVDAQVLDDLDVQAGEKDVQRSRTEGGKKVTISARVERDPTLRNEAIKAHGTACAVCCWDYELAYGSWGAGYAEVHHLIPLGGEPAVRETNAEHDLAVLCANCHRMVHRKRGLTLSVEELKSKVNTEAILAWARKLSASDGT